MTKKHYTAGGNPSHAGVFFLPDGKNIDMVIDHIEWREREIINGREDSKFIAIFKKNPYTDLPMVLNKVNKERLLKLANKGSWDILDIKDLKPDMVLKGTVRNVIDFGAFIDIGVHQDGLVHISQICDKYIKHPSEVLKVGDVVDVKIISVDPEKNRISLTMRF